MSHRHFWLRIASRRAELLPGESLISGPGRNAENEGSLVPTESRSSILGGPGEPNLRDKVEK